MPAIGEDPNRAFFRTRESANGAWKVLRGLAGALPEDQHFYASKNLVKTCPSLPVLKEFPFMSEETTNLA